MKTCSNRSVWKAFFLCILGLSACNPASSIPFILEGDALPTSQPNEGNPLVLSVRLLERIEKSPSTYGFGPLHFGSAIALYGDTIAVGAPESTAVQGHQKGMVFVYQRNGDDWVEIAELVASDKEDGVQSDLLFGRALALEADTLAVGAPEARDAETGNSVGAVYIFQRRGIYWEETAILHALDKTTNARFGKRVVLREDVLLVSGGQAIYVFERAGDGWVEQARLTDENLGERDRFGFSLAVEGGHLAIGTLIYDPEVSRFTSSSVYLYHRTRDGWDPETILTPEEGEWPGFGSSLDLEGETLVVGANGDETAGHMIGAVYIYENGLGGWKQQTKLVAGDGPFTFFHGLGSSVDLEGDILAVGAPGDSSQGSLLGSVYLFRRQGETWIDLLKLWPNDEDYEGAFFGADLKLSGNTMLVSAPEEFGNAVYIYEIGTEVE